MSNIQFFQGEFLLDIWKNGKYDNMVTKSSNSICTDMILSFPLRVIVKPDKNCIARSVIMTDKFIFTYEVLYEK